MTIGSKATRIASIFSLGLLACPAQANDPRTLYRYDALGRLVSRCIARAGDGELARYQLDGASNRARYSNMRTDVALYANQGIYSANGRFMFWMQPDGNLVAYGNFGSGWTPLGWATNTVGSGASVAYFQSDGNLVLYTSSGTSVWSSSTGAYPCATLNVADDGNITINAQDGAVVWATNTGGH